MANWEKMYSVKFVFFKKVTKIDEIFTINLTLCSKILSIFVGILENKNFTGLLMTELILFKIFD